MGLHFRFVRAVIALVLVSGALVWPGSSPASPVAAGDPTAVRLITQPFLSGFSAPQYIMHAGDGTGRLFVVEQAGRIQLIKNGVEQGYAVSRYLVPRLAYTTGGERGLYTIAFRRNMSSNG